MFFAVSALWAVPPFARRGGGFVLHLPVPGESPLQLCAFFFFGVCVCFRLSGGNVGAFFGFVTRVCVDRVERRGLFVM